MIIQERTRNIDRNRRELALHGTQEFPCTGYYLHLTDRAEECIQGCIPWHWHDDLEIIRISTGIMQIQIPGKIFHLKQGECIFINSNILHYGAAEPTAEIESLVFHPLLPAGSVDSVFARKYIMPLMQSTAADCYVFSSDNDLELIKNFVTAFKAMKEESWGYEQKVRECLSHICLSLCRKFSCTKKLKNNCKDSDSVRIRKMLAFIHSRYAEELTLFAIAQAADIGNRECLRCFQRMIKISPIQYLLKYRIMQSTVLLLKNRSMSISEIAGRCGFASPSSFSQTFKRFLLCTPAEYRGCKSCKSIDNGHL